MSLTYSPKIILDGLVLCLDPSQNKSYPSANLSVKDGLILWLDSSDDSSFSYSSGTLVSQWRDKSGLNNHANQSTAANQPTRNSSTNSRKTVTFDGTNDFLDGTSTLALANGYTAFTIVKSSATGERDILTSSPFALSADIYLYQRASDGRLGNWPTVYTSNVISLSTWYLLSVAVSSAGSETLYLNGSSQTSSSRSITNTRGYRVAANSSGSEYWSGEIAEIIVFNRQLTTTELKLVHTYLGQKWGISNTDRSIIDLSGNDYNGLFGNGTTANMPDYDFYNKGALAFNGSSDEVNFGDVLKFTTSQNFTLEVWVNYIPNSTSYVPLLSKEDASTGFGYALKVDETYSYNPYLVLTGPSAYRYANININDGLWHHIVGVAKSSSATIDMYVDGVLRNGISNLTSWTGTPTSNALRLGKNVGSAFFKGKLSNAKIYNRALSAAEIAQNYEAQKSKFANTIVQQGLVLNLDAGNPYSYAGGGTTWYDTSGNGLNAAAAGNINYRNLYGGVFSVYPSVNSYFNTATVSTLNLGSASFSMEAWVYFDASVASDNVYRGVMSLGADSNNYVYISKWRSGLYSGLYVQYIAGAATITGVYQNNEYDPVSKWTHVIATKSGSSLTFYVNGSIVYTVTNLTTTFTGNSYVILANAHAGVGTLNGYIGESRVYNITLSAAQVLQNFNATRGRYGL